MTWIRLVLVVFCIGSIHGLPQEIAIPSDDLKPSALAINWRPTTAPSVEFLTKNPIDENPSSVNSKPNDLEEVVFFAMKLVAEFILNQVNAAISGNFNLDAFMKAFDNAFKFTYASLVTHIAISFHNQGFTPFHLFHMN